MELLTILEGFVGKKILVVGDVMLDTYLWGDVSRISPEAPVPIVAVSREGYVLGGACNVAANILALGAKVYAVGVVGNDMLSEVFKRLMIEKGMDTSGILVDTDRCTTVKTRVIARNQHIVRLDREDTKPISEEMRSKILKLCEERLDACNALIVSDYAKGMISGELMNALKEVCRTRQIPVIVDPKPAHSDMYVGVTLVTPNYTEACGMLPSTKNLFLTVEEKGIYLSKMLQSAVLMTRGEHGMSLFEKGDLVRHIPTFAKRVSDVVGAGDTVVAAVTLALVSGASFGDASLIANHAAGITVGKLGTSTVSLEEIRDSIRAL